METNLMLLVFAVLLCCYSSSETKAWTLLERYNFNFSGLSFTTIYIYIAKVFGYYNNNLNCKRQQQKLSWKWLRNFLHSWEVLEGCTEIKNCKLLEKNYYCPILSYKVNSFHTFFFLIFFFFANLTTHHNYLEYSYLPDSLDPCNFFQYYKPKYHVSMEKLAW